MREKMKKKKNMIIGGLLAVVFLMSVGYAAFASNLNITSTASTTNSWNILITNITSTATGTATDTTVNKQPNILTADISAELQSPGDKVTYEITVENSGSLNAKLESLTMTESINEAVIFTKNGIEQGSVLNANTTQTLIVTIEYNPEVTEQPSLLTANTTITFNYVQSTEEYDQLYTIEYWSYTTKSPGTRVKVYEKQVYFNELGINMMPDEIELQNLGYIFDGWNTNARATGLWLDEKDATYSYIVNGNLSKTRQKVYASWTTKSYTINFDTAGGSYADSIDLLWEDYVQPLLPFSGKLGFTLEGWYTEPNGVGMKIEDSTVFSEIYQYVYGNGKDDDSKDITIYANWVENS